MKKPRRRETHATRAGSGLSAREPSPRGRRPGTLQLRTCGRKHRRSFKDGAQRRNTASAPAQKDLQTHGTGADSPVGVCLADTNRRKTYQWPVSPGNDAPARQRSDPRTREGQQRVLFCSVSSRPSAASAYGERAPTSWGGA